MGSTVPVLCCAMKYFPAEGDWPCYGAVIGLENNNKCNIGLVKNSGGENALESGPRVWP